MNSSYFNFIAKLLVMGGLLISCSPAKENPYYETRNFKYAIVPHDFNKNSPTKSLDFQNIETEVLNLGFANKGVLLKTEISRKHADWKVLIDYPLLDSVHFILKNNDGALLQEKVWNSTTFGNKDYELPNFSIPNTNSVESSNLYVVIHGSTQLSFPIHFKSSSKAKKLLRKQNYLAGLFYGIVLALLLYNLFIALSTKDIASYYYISYIFFIAITQSVFDGYFQAFINMSLEWNELKVLTIAPSIGGVMAVEFAQRFLQTHRYARWIDKGLLAFKILYIAIIILTLTPFYAVTFRLTDLTALFIAIYGVIFSLHITLKGFNPAKFFLIAFSLFLLSLIIFVLGNFNLLSQNIFTINALKFGLASQIILLSMALADRINVLRKEKEESQEERIRLADENERIILQQNRRLDSEVKNRTSELTKTNQNLEETLTNLKEAQTQLVDSEKMASLGQLTAGIAHEINNPINFVTSNIKPLQRDVEDLYSIIDKFDTVESGKEIQGFKEIEDLKEELEYTYIREEIGSLLSGIADGANRTADIIKGLKTFSRLDEDVKKRTDIIEGMESTLIILNTKLKNKIGVVKEYQEGMPNVECFPGKLNQAFMNILNNAIYAIEHKSYPEGEDPTLTIKIERQESNAIISIGDNGIGMNEATRQKIFEPFYTTKDVGEGTGLGMSIVFNIIEKHNGKMELNSQEGIGTEFRIFLPM